MTIKMNGSEKALESLGRIIEKFQNESLGQTAMACRIAAAGAHANLPASKWSSRNMVMAYMQSGTLDCRGANQWKAVGRLIQKGGRAVYILRPIGFETDKDRDGGPMVDGQTRYVLTGFKGIPVFPIHQTRPMNSDEAEQAGVQPVDYAPAELPPLMDVAERLGVSVEFVALAENGSALGYYIDGFKHIQIGTQDDDSWRVFFHELGHAVHYEMLRQRGEGSASKLSAAHREAVAEMISAVLADAYTGEDTTMTAWHYIKGQAPAGETLSDEDTFELVAHALTDIIDSISVIYGEPVGRQK